MIKIQFTAFVIMLCTALQAFADQAIYLDKVDAERAVALLKNAESLKTYCAPCNDPSVKHIVVASILSAKVNYQDFWEVQINGKGEDLAYLYFLDNNKWRNVAMALNIPVSDVSEFITGNETNPAASDDSTKALAQVELDAANKRLNEVWNATTAKTRKQLLPEQRQWLKKRENDCVLKAAASPETNINARDIIKLRCMTVMTESKTQELARKILSLSK